MKEFMGQDFLLNTNTAKELYNIAKKQPVFDYYCKLNAKDIAENKRFSDLTEAWIETDVLKYRAMRSYKVDEYYITGDATPFQKFSKWAEVVPMLMGSPLYHQTHLELQRFFGIKTPLSPATAKEIWDKANEVVTSASFSAINILKKYNVKAVCTLNDPTDSLQYHIEISQNIGCDTLVLPTFNPDKAFLIENPSWTGYIKKLGSVVDFEIISYSDLLSALLKRLMFFRSLGGRMANHNIFNLNYTSYTQNEVEEIFRKALKNEALTDTEISKFKTCLLWDLSRKYNEFGFICELHFNAKENANEKLTEFLGENAGFYSFEHFNAVSFAREFLNNLYKENSLPKIILYSAYPEDYKGFASLIPSFLEEKGKIQLALDLACIESKKEIESYIETLINSGLPHSIGISTGGSFLKYPIYEYFRRILADKLGYLVENGEYPSYKELLSKVISQISFNNIKSYLEI